jgi:hypothetical protein
MKMIIKEIDIEEAIEILASQLSTRQTFLRQKYSPLKLEIENMTKDIVFQEKELNKQYKIFSSKKIYKDPMRVKDKNARHRTEWNLIDTLNRLEAHCSDLKRYVKKRDYILGDALDLKKHINALSFKEIKKKCTEDLEWISKNYSCCFKKQDNEGKPTLIITFKTKEDSILTNLDGESFNLGNFMIDIFFRISENDFLVKAQELNPNYNIDSEYFHPHVSAAAEVCLGEGLRLMQNYLRLLEINQIPEIIEAILNTYNPNSAYYPLEFWNQRRCSSCDEFSEETLPCHSCGDGICSNCAILCSDCGKEFCGECIGGCESCRENFCEDCMDEDDNLCRHCQEEIQKEKEEEEKKEEDQEEDQEKKEEPKPPHTERIIADSQLEVEMCADCHTLIQKELLNKCYKTLALACDNCMVTDKETGYLVRKTAIEENLF